MPVEAKPEKKVELEEIRKVLQSAQEEEDAAVCERWRATHSTTDSRTETVTGASHDSTISRESFYDEPDLASTLATSKSTEEVKPGEDRVAFHNEGATPLFRSIEESDWDAAARILEHEPKQASIWVESTGTVSTTFNWSLWKRLPLHEAARRQPPTRFLVKLIQAFPDATSCATQFGELPLHLAVECGAEPAIVHLLALHYWPGVIQVEQSGRTALDILLESAILDPLEQATVGDSLKSSMATFAELRQQHSDDLEAAEKQHRSGLRGLRRKFDSDLKLEHEQQKTLLKQVESLKKQLNEQHQVIQSQNTAIARYKSAEEVWNTRYSQSETQSAHWKELYRQEQGSTANLVRTVAGRDETISNLKATLERNQVAATRMHMVQRKKVSNLLTTVQRQLVGTLNKMEVLDQTLEEQTSDLRFILNDSLLEDEGGMLCHKPPLTSSSDSGLASSSESVAEDDVVDDEALRRAAQAASSVLK